MRHATYYALSRARDREVILDNVNGRAKLRPVSEFKGAPSPAPVLGMWISSRGMVATSEAPF